MTDWLPLILGFPGGVVLALLLGWTALTKPVIDVRFDQRTVLVADPNRRTLTLIQGADDTWVCVSHAGGKSCKDLRDVAGWILEDQPH